MLIPKLALPHKLSQENINRTSFNFSFFYLTQNTHNVIFTGPRLKKRTLVYNFFLLRHVTRSCFFMKKYEKYMIRNLIKPRFVDIQTYYP